MRNTAKTMETMPMNDFDIAAYIREKIVPLPYGKHVAASLPETDRETLWAIIREKPDLFHSVSKNPNLTDEDRRAMRAMSYPASSFRYTNTEENWKIVAQRAQEITESFLQGETMPSYVVDAILATKPSKARFIIGDDKIVMTEDQLRKLASLNVTSDHKRTDVINLMDRPTNPTDWVKANAETILRWAMNDCIYTPYIRSDVGRAFKRQLQEAIDLMRTRYPLGEADARVIKAHTAIGKMALNLDLQTWKMTDYPLTAAAEVALIKYIVSSTAFWAKQVQNPEAKMVWDLLGRELQVEIERQRLLSPTKPSSCTTLFVRFIEGLHTDNVSAENWVWLSQGTRDKQCRDFIAKHVDVVDLLS